VLAAALLLAAAWSSQAGTAPREEPSTAVVVTLAGNYVPDGELPDEPARLAQRLAIRVAQDAVLAELPASGVRAVRRFAYTPQLALTVDAAALERLLRSQRVAAVQKDTAQSQHG
jgi:roadblock/LC7 domain-containing protein